MANAVGFFPLTAAPITQAVSGVPMQALDVPIIILAVVFILIIVRQVGNLKLQIWQIMLAGAGAVLLSGSTTLVAALRAINFDILLFLFCMFVVGDALEESGYLAHLSYKYFKRAASLDTLVLMVLAGSGLLSALLMNDTLCIIGTPVMLLLARKHAMPAKPLLFALAFGVTLGSVLSPIGNPQNLLIAVQGSIPNPFVLFLRWLLVPSLINLVVAFAFIRLYYRTDFHDAALNHSQEPIRSRELASLSKISLWIILVLIAVKVISASVGAHDFLRLTHIALAACLPILVASPRRWHIIKRIDWHTLVFFAAMFVLMDSVWNTGFFQSILDREQLDMRSPSVLIGVGVIVSQFVSNVPLVALILPALLKAGAGTPEMLALAAGSTIAGNLTILGAASNVIIIQNAERRSGETLGFWEFLRIGAPLTMVNAFVYWVFLRFL